MTLVQRWDEKRMDEKIIEVRSYKTELKIYPSIVFSSSFMSK